MRTGIVAACAALLLVGVSQATTTSLDSGTVVDTITSLDQVEQVVRDTQWQFWQLVPPATDDPFYLHSERIVRTVDWDSKEWPKTFSETDVRRDGNGWIVWKHVSVLPPYGG